MKTPSQPELPAPEIQNLSDDNRRGYLPQFPTSWLGLAVFLLIFAAGFRVLRVFVLPELPNFSPLMAIAFCGAWFLPGWLALAVPLTALVISDILLTPAGASLIPSLGDLIRYACYAGAVGMGYWMRRRNAGALGFWSGVVGSAVGFYLITNSLSWFGSTLYAQSFAGWVQALTVGLPGYPPTWTFFRNSLVSDLLFSGIMVTAAVLASRIASLRSPRQTAHVVPPSR